MFKINTYNYLSKNKLIHAKIPKSFRDKIEFKICYNDKCYIKTKILPPIKGGYEYNFNLE